MNYNASLLDPCSFDLACRATMLPSCRPLTCYAVWRFPLAARVDVPRHRGSTHAGLQSWCGARQSDPSPERSALRCGLEGIPQAQAGSPEAMPHLLEKRSYPSDSPGMYSSTLRIS